MSNIMRVVFNRPKVQYMMSDVLAYTLFKGFYGLRKILEFWKLSFISGGKNNQGMRNKMKRR